MERKKDRSPPANWQDFEDLCLKLWRPRLIDAKKNGRSGQPQTGVDIFGRDRSSAVIEFLDQIERHFTPYLLEGS